MVLSDSSDYDKPAVPPPSSTEMPPSTKPSDVEMRGRRQMCEAMKAVPESARTTPASAARTATAVSETARVMPVVVAEAISQRDAEASGGSVAEPGGLGQGRMFRTVWRESQL